MDVDGKMNPPPASPWHHNVQADLPNGDGDGSDKAALPSESPIHPELPSMPKWQHWTLWLSMIASFYVMGLDSFTMAVYLINASSNFDSLVQYTTLAVIESMILAVGQPPFAKFADVFGRPFSWVVSLVFFVIGTIVMASSGSFATLAAGIIFYAIGYTGVTFLQQLILADLVVPTRRVLVSNLLLFHYLINFGVAGKITGALVPAHWRWGPAMFTILIPVVNAPIVFVLYYQQIQAARKGLVPHSRSSGMPVFKSAKDILIQFDLIGLLFLTAGFCLLLLPLTIADDAPNGYSTGYIVAMLVLGAVFLVIWPIIELKVPYPLVHLREFAMNIDILLPSLIYAVDQFSTTLSYQPALQWVEIVFDYDTSAATYFYYAQSLSNVVFSMISGGIAMYTRRYKWLSFIGGCIRVLGVGLMMRYRTTGSSTAQLVLPQIIQGIGGGMLTANLAVAAQQSVPHARVAIVTAVVLLIVNLGDAIGSAVTGAVQQNLLGQLHHYVDPVAGNSTLAVQVYGAGATAAKLYPLGSPIRDAISDAWSANMHQLLVGALVSGIINALMCIGMPDRTLAKDTQNNVADEPTGLTFGPVMERESSTQRG